MRLNYLITIGYFNTLNFQNLSDMTKRTDKRDILDAAQELYENCVFILAQNYYNQSKSGQHFPSDFDKFDHQKIADREFLPGKKSELVFETISKKAALFGMDSKTVIQSIYDKAKPVAFSIANVMYDQQSRTSSNLEMLAEIIPKESYGSPKVTKCKDGAMHVTMKKKDFILPFGDLIRVISANQAKVAAQKLTSLFKNTPDQGVQK